VNPPNTHQFKKVIWVTNREGGEDMVEVTLDIDVDHLLRSLGFDAVRNKSSKATLHHKMIRATTRKFLV
jgi:predicted glycosyltransferase